MNYFKRNFIKVLVILFLPSYIESITNKRDIILSPNKSINHPGKIEFFHLTNISDENKQEPSISWEEALKFSMYLTLKDLEKKHLLKQKDEELINATSLHNITADIENILTAKFSLKNESNKYLNFGDIVTLSHGKLETNEKQEFYFSNFENCDIVDKECFEDDLKKESEKLVALWTIQKIRHRSSNHGHRYEIRITIIPVNKSNIQKSIETSFRAIGQSYILRDVDYPKIFNNQDHVVENYDKRNIDRMGHAYHSSILYNSKKENGPLDLNYKQELNTGEYYIHKPSHETSKFSFNKMYKTPTTPMIKFPYTNEHLTSNLNYEYSKLKANNIRFPESSNTILTKKFSDESKLTTPVITTHLHHHYYLNKQKVPVLKLTEYEKEKVVSNENHSEFVGDLRGTTPIQNNYYTTNAPEFTTHQAHSDQLISTVPKYQYYEIVSKHPQYHAQQINIDPQYHQAVTEPYHQTSPFIPQIKQQISHYTSQQPENHQTTINYHPSHQAHTHAHIQIPGEYSNIQQQQYTTNPQYIINYTPSHPKHLQFTTNHHSETLQTQSGLYEPTTTIPFFKQHDIPTETIKFSDPDPIYHPQLYKLNHQHFYNTQHYSPTTKEFYKSTHAEAPDPEVQNAAQEDDLNVGKHSSVEINLSEKETSPCMKLNQKYKTNKFDSINAQLPPPDVGTDTKIPYVEVSNSTEQSVSSSVIIVPANRSKSETSIKNKLNPKPTLRQFFKTTTDKPVLKWMPKIPKRKLGSNFNGLLDNDTTIYPTKAIVSKTLHSDSTQLEKYITVTPTTPIDFTTETTIIPQTEKSFSTSISIKIGNENTNGSKQKDLNNNKIELVKAEIQSLETNNNKMQLFRASEERSNNQKMNDNMSFDPIAMSIIQHAKTISNKN